MELDYLGIVLRWLHILPAMAMVGGTLYMRLAVVPATQKLPEEHRKNVADILRSRWARVVHVSVLLLLLSGIVNLMRIVGNTPPVNASLYHPLFGIKFLLAMAIFFIASVLMGTSSLAEKFRQNAARWLTVNLTLAIVLVCISGVLRSIEKPPKPADSDARLAPNAAGQTITSNDLGDAKRNQGSVDERTTASLDVRNS